MIQLQNVSRYTRTFRYYIDVRVNEVNECQSRDAPVARVQKGRSYSVVLFSPLPISLEKSLSRTTTACRKTCVPT